MEKIGKTEEELDAGKMIECRKIVKNIIKFGVCDKQKIQIINLFALELESRDAMNMLIDVVKKIKSMDDSIKFSLTNSELEYNNTSKSNKLLDI